MGIIKYIVIFYLISFWVIGCSSAPTKEEPITSEPIFEPDEAAEVVNDKIKHVIGNPAVLSLWQKSKLAEEGGDLATAVLQVERALRIEGDDAVLWSRLAELHLKQGNANQAQEMAKKSNSLSVTDNVLVYRNWLIIADARRLLGDLSGAEEAEYTAGTFR